ncbi:hypothetical protein ROU88_09640 [Macrococcus capreoli]
MENVQIKIFEREYIKVTPYETMYGRISDKRIENRQEYQERVNRFLMDHTIYSITPMIDGDFDEGSGGFSSKILVCYKAPGSKA